jgi:hypothetical protein
MPLQLLTEYAIVWPHLEATMSYSNVNPRWHRMMQGRADALAELEKQRARELQRQDPTLTWGQALKLAIKQPTRKQAR